MRAAGSAVQRLRPHHTPFHVGGRVVVDDVCEQYLPQGLLPLQVLLPLCVCAQSRRRRQRLLLLLLLGLLLVGLLWFALASLQHFGLRLLLLLLLVCALMLLQQQIPHIHTQIVGVWGREGAESWCRCTPCTSTDKRRRFVCGSMLLLLLPTPCQLVSCLWGCTEW